MRVRAKGRKRSGQRFKVLALALACATTVSLVVGMQSSAFADSHFLDVFAQAKPSTVSKGSTTLLSITTSNGIEDDPVANATLSVDFFDNGNLKVDLSATKAQSDPGITCKFMTVESEGTFQNLTCKLGDLASGQDKTVNAVVVTSVDSVDDIEFNAFVDAPDGSGGNTFGDIFTTAPTNTEKSGYVAPGKTITLGPKNPTADNPTVGSFSLPKKEFDVPSAFTAASTPKLVPGPGAVITVTADDPSTAPTACGGQPCDGQLFTVTGTGAGGSFDGYNDPKHPAFMKVVWFGGSVPVNSTLYIIKAGVGTPAPTCVKVKGVFTNTPCLFKHSVVKKTGKITDTIALLSGDPTGGRR